MFITSVLSSILFGLLAFFTPCTFPLLPSFLGFLTGVGMNELKDKLYLKENRNRIIKHTLSYVLGSSLMLVILGSAVGYFGYLLKSYRFLILDIGDFLVIIFGISLLFSLNINFNIKLIESLYKKTIDKKKHKSSYILSFLLGALFTLSWSPCISPFLGSILVLATSEGSFVNGGILLLFYALGLNIPFLLIGIFLGSFAGYLDFIKKNIRYFTLTGGIVIILTGVFMLLTGLLQIAGIIYSIPLI